MLFPKVKAALLMSVAGYCLLPASAAWAQEDPTKPTLVGLTAEDVGVNNRPRPEYDAKGIPLGAFRLFPSVNVTASYDDNVLRQPAAITDWYVEAAPTVRLQSQWGRHFLEVYGGVDNFNYFKNDRLNLTDWNLGTDGRLDATRELVISGGGSYGEKHEALTSPNTVGFQASPNRYFQPHAELSATYQPNRLGFGAGITFDRYDWQNTPKNGGGLLFNTDRNENEYGAYAKSFYDFSPGYTGFVKVSYDDRAYDQFLDRTGSHRSSTGYHFDGGVDMQISHLVKGEFFVGYLEQHFAQNTPSPLKNISGLDYGANLDWFASPLFTLHLTASHTVSDVTLAGVSASNDQNVGVSGDYEVLYNLILHGYFDYTQSHFSGSNRTDDLPSAGVKANWLMNNYLSGYVGYSYSERASSTPATDFNDNTISVGVTGHF